MADLNPVFFLLFFFFLFEYLVMFSDSSRKQIFSEILVKFSQFIMKIYVVCTR